MSFAFSQENNESTYSYIDAFKTEFYNSPGTITRSASGKPGHGYWQNSADYDIDVRLDTINDNISGSQIIRYTNNSPDELNFVWLHVDQNLFKSDSRGNAVIPIIGSRNGSKGEILDGGFKISTVQIVSEKGRKKSYTNTEYEIYDTRMKILLSSPLKPNGGKLSLKIDFSFLSPQYGSDRMGVLKTKNGKLYTIAQWYPRMCVYDDLNGWNNLPYLGQGEFYLDYGDFKVNITAPSDHIVVCSGELLNAEEVYTSEQLSRWEEAENSNKTIMIRTADEVNMPNTRPKDKNEITWRFKMENSRDVAWASSSSFIIDAAKIDLPSGKKAIAISAYPIESSGGNSWERSTEYTKASVEHYSKKWFEYPYPTAINVAGNVRGMEYPGVSFCSYESSGASLWGVTDHEFGHNWFPMIVGSNERVSGWMDEGFNTFINYLSTKDFNDGEYRTRMPNMRFAAQIFTRDGLEPIITAPDNLIEENMGLQYYKTGMFLMLLRNNVLGVKRFDDAFKEYIHRWAYKHPSPDDFFRTIEDVSGEDLGWFWRSWVLNNWKLDQAVSGVSYVNNDPKQGSIVTIKNMKKIPMPVTIEITTISGGTIRKTLPVEIWKKNIEWSFIVDTNEALKKVSIDPDYKYPDSNSRNNVWRGQ
ncbi:MAG: peptidase M1 [Flavobacteriaceae bacterium]|nr:peptidase M1 [Flavobacteriaceae bacterium]